MEPLPDLEALRQQLQKTHVEHILRELDLAATFLELSGVERGMQNPEAASLSLEHAHQAISGARKGLAHLDSAEHRADLERRLDEADAVIRQYEAQKSLPVAGASLS